MESPPPLITIDQSFTFIINCTAMGVPTPQVVWRLNWGHVPDKCSQSNTLLEENRSYGELTCPQASQLDQGAYSCEAINSMGSCFAGSAGCGQPGQDAILVVRPDSGTCTGGYFNSEAETADQCLQCYCSGQADTCTSSDLHLSILPPPAASFTLESGQNLSSLLRLNMTLSSQVPELRTSGDEKYRHRDEISQTDENWSEAVCSPDRGDQSPARRRLSPLLRPARVSRREPPQVLRS